MYLDQDRQRRMKHYFIINPAAGSGRDQQAMVPRILDAAKKWGADYELHRTSGPGEATIYVRGRLAADPGGAARFYACGGDGTAAEILNGLYGAGNAELAIVPVGSGNDYIRNFGGRERFLDIAAQLAGEAVPVDAIRFSYTPVESKGGALASHEADGSGVCTAYALNMINMGFDARVASRLVQMKNRFFLKGTGAYVAGIVRELAGYRMNRAVFRPEGEEAFETDILLAGVGSGRFSGGGFEGIPVAAVNDGMLDLIVIEPLTRGEFIRLVGVYHDGRHLDHPGLKGKYRLFRVDGVAIEPVSGLVFTADGEALYTDELLTVSLAPEKIRFVIPDGVERP